MAQSKEEKIEYRRYKRVCLARTKKLARGSTQIEKLRRLSRQAGVKVFANGDGDRFKIRRDGRTLHKDLASGICADLLRDMIFVATLANSHDSERHEIVRTGRIVAGHEDLSSVQTRI